LEKAGKAPVKGNGELLVMVPIAEGMKTFEDPSITTAKDRELFFGQYDHCDVTGIGLGHIAAICPNT